MVLAFLHYRIMGDVELGVVFWVELGVVFWALLQ